MSTFLDGRREYSRPLSRFLVFGLAAVVAISALTARLFYMQVISNTEFTSLADSNRTVLEAIPSTRGLIYDRSGAPLVTNVPTFSVKIRPADLPEERRDEVVDRLSALIGTSVADINAAIDGNPGSTFDAVRVAQDVPKEKANLIAEASLELPGVEVVVESRRQYLEGPLLSQILGYTGPISSEQLDRLKSEGYLPDDLIGKTGLEAYYEDDLRGTYGERSVERDATGRKLQVLKIDSQAEAGNSLKLTIDTREQKLAQQALQWGMKEAGLKRGVVIVMNPQTGEILAMVSLPTYDDNAFATGISAKAYAALLANKDKPLLNHAVAAHYPPGSTYKLVAGTGVLGDKRITDKTRVQTRGYLTLGGTRFYDWNHRGFGACTIYCGFGHSSDTFFFQMAGKLGADRLGYWAHQYGFGSPTGIDLPNEVSGIVPTNEWKQATFGMPMFGGEVYQSGIGQGYDVVTPIQLITAYAALANGGTVYEPQVVKQVTGPDGTVVRPFQKKIKNKMKVSPETLRIMRNAARSVVTLRHTYNLVELPIKVAGKSGTAEFGTRDSKGRLPFSSWFVGFVPKDARHGSFNSTDSPLMVLAFAYDSRTIGNVATEIVKYYLQLHFGIKKDYRLPQLLKRGNFYQSN